MTHDKTDKKSEAGRSDERARPAGGAGPFALPYLCWEPEGAPVVREDEGGERPPGLLDYTDRPYADAVRTIDGDALKRMLKITDGVVSGPVVIRGAIIEARGELDLHQLNFKYGLTITDSVFRCPVNLSFCAFGQGVDLTGTIFEARVNFRAARVEGDFRMPLAGFGAHACFDDMHVRELIDAEGADFEGASFDRAEVCKSALFCCALLDDGRAVRTRFRGEVTFNDARLGGPVYFGGAHFRQRVYFDRARIDSSAFFNCDLLDTKTDPSQPKREVRRPPRREVKAMRRRFCPTEFEDAASFIGAHINGSASFSGARFGSKRADGDESGPCADFRRIQIEGTALFNPCAPPKSGLFRRVRFYYDAKFWNARIKGAAQFEAVYFGGKADFEHVEIGRGAYFDAAGPHRRPVPARFRGDVSFIDADIEGTASFEGAQFDGEADFERLTTGGSLYFRAYMPDTNPPTVGPDGRPVLVPTRFARSARFLGCQTRSNVEFGGARFVAAPPRPNGTAENDEANFSRMVVGGSFSLRPRPGTSETLRFEKRAVFTGMDIKGRAEFSGTFFGADADFTGMHIGGNAHFGYRFRPEHGNGAGGGAQQQIEPATFCGAAVFNGATFDNRVDFDGVLFERKADFTGVTGVGTVSFREAKFRADVVFREARFSSLWFDRKGLHRKGWIISVPVRLWALRSRKSNSAYKRLRAEAQAEVRQFRRAVDLRGCVYDRIDVKLRSLLEQVKGSAANDPQQYDRQPYTQMSKALRAVGDDRRAEFVYVKQRIRELAVTWERLLRDLRSLRLWRAFRDLANLLLDLLLWAIAQFGVQPERLLVISFVVIAIGARVFSFGGAVQDKVSDTGQPPTATIITRDKEPWRLSVDAREKKIENLDWPDSLRFSVSQFLPVVDIPSGSKWKPAERGDFCVLPCNLNAPQMPYDVYGSLHRLLGAVLVPLLLAAVAASLYRRFKTEM